MFVLKRKKEEKKIENIWYIKEVFGYYPGRQNELKDKEKTF